MADARELLARIARTVVAAVRSMQPPDDLPPKSGTKEAKVEETVQVLRAGVIIVKCDGLPAKKGTPVYLRGDGTATTVPAADYALLGHVEQDTDRTRRGHRAFDVEARFSVPRGCAAVRLGGAK